MEEASSPSDEIPGPDRVYEAASVTLVRQDDFSRLYLAEDLLGERDRPEPGRRPAAGTVSVEAPDGRHRTPSE